MEDVKLVQDFLDLQNFSVYNIWFFKEVDGEGKFYYEVWLVFVFGLEFFLDFEVIFKLKSYEFWGSFFQVIWGDYVFIFQKVVEQLEKVKVYVVNSYQGQMLVQYIESFIQGFIEVYKRGFCFWIQDKGFIVESYIGFIESYCDFFGF